VTSILREAVDLERKHLGAEHPTTLSGMSVLAAVLIKEGKYAEAEKWQEETLEIQRRVLGPNHPETAGSTYNLACLAMRRGESERAIVLLREAVDHELPAAIALGMKSDPDLQAIYGDPRFQEMVVEVENRAKTGSRPGQPASGPS
jgi:tetratricopeptide (TPR) repeat protein